MRILVLANVGAALGTDARLSLSRLTLAQHLLNAPRLKPTKVTVGAMAHGAAQTFGDLCLVPLAIRRTGGNRSKGVLVLTEINNQGKSVGFAKKGHRLNDFFPGNQERQPLIPDDGEDLAVLTDDADESLHLRIGVLHHRIGIGPQGVERHGDNRERFNQEESSKEQS